jgi:uncharacterized damage-inducible protein DinB
MKEKFANLSQLFDYDLWANRQWLDFLTRKGVGDPDLKIFQHILGAQEIWYLRCLGTPPSGMPDFKPTQEKLVELHSHWRTFLEVREDDPLIHYHRFNGEPGHMRLSQIAQHVVNHGTYHRGELRGLCLARGEEEFPETDYAGFIPATGLNT